MEMTTMVGFFPSCTVDFQAVGGADGFGLKFEKQPYNFVEYLTRYHGTAGTPLLFTTLKVVDGDVQSLSRTLHDGNSILEIGIQSVGRLVGSKMTI
jgi:hypothetical protein